jgi:hypothetical protein
MPKDPFIREKFTKERTAARNFAKEYFERCPKDQYQTEVESWRHLQSANIEFTMKRLRESIVWYWPHSISPENEWPLLILGVAPFGSVFTFELNAGRRHIKIG